MLLGIFLWGTIWYSDLEVESNLLGNTGGFTWNYYLGIMDFKLLP